MMLEERAKVYIESEWSHLTSYQKDNVLQKILKISNSAAFKTNPRVFLAEWMQSRADVEEFQIPDHPAMEFYISIVE